MCSYVNEGMNINGPYYYCAAATFGLKLNTEELEVIGCTETQREACKALMEITLGAATLPAPLEKNTSGIIDFNIRKFYKNTLKTARNHQGGKLKNQI